ncbi:MAG: histidine kinase [Gammaproteobacteria bacterium]|nr:histidine kinase [Gammaproteobacteria bacterium]
MVNRPSQNIVQDALDQISQSWLRMIDCIIHDLTTPLALTRMAGTSFREMLPNLIAGYQLAVEHKLLSEPINEDRLNAFSSILTSATGENINNMFEFLNSLRALCKKSFSACEETTILSAKTSIEAALKRYPFTNSKERPLIRLDCQQDFQFKCEPVFINALLDRLLSHAIDAIQDAGQGNVHILISAEINPNYQIYFKINAKIADDFPEYIFNRFFLKNRDGTITPALGFCRLALLQRGGGISCHVVDGNAEFIIELSKKM